jgi:small subunit ribosomal protein S6
MNYETTFIVSPELPTEKIEELVAKAVKIVESSKGAIKVIQQLGKKKFAYPVNKFREGSYVYIEFSGDGGTVGSLENFFKFDDLIIRFLTVKSDNKKNVAKSCVKSNSETDKPNNRMDNDNIEVTKNESAATE